MKAKARARAKPARKGRARRRAPSRLSEYRARRRFEVTPEPPPEARAAPGEHPLFMVHKHDARRLHYDLRLEMDGALASWAVPKGPSYDPAERRLAVETEDHPLAYASFEGRIPEGEYGAGDSIIWDRGVYETDPPGQAGQMRERGHLVLILAGQKLAGRWHLVRTRPRGGKSQWLLFKGKDELARPGYDVVAERPESVATGRRVTRGPVRARARRADHPSPIDLLLRVWPPMKATLSQPSAAGDETHLFEVKYDGYRALAAISGGRVALQSRNGLDLSARFPEVAEAVGRLEAAEAVLDGEIVAVAGGRATFENLQASVGEHRYLVFDCLWLDGEDLRDRPIEARRELAESVLANARPPLGLAERVEGSVAEALAKMRARGTEGLIAKRRGSPYRGGRSRDWLKLKLTSSQELAVIGYTPSSDQPRAIGALLLGVVEDGRMRYAGKVGTGFSHETARALWKTLERDRIPSPAAEGAPRIRVARWVEPRLVAEVAFTEWTRDGKLRHPSFRGLRDDKQPIDCVRETPTA